MMNAQFAPAALSTAFNQALTTLDTRLFGGTASSSVVPHAAVASRTPHQ
jgi:hypothetical protein